MLNSAIAQFCLEIIAKHGEAAQRLCNKDPLTLKMGSYVIELFPNVSAKQTNKLKPFYLAKLFISQLFFRRSFCSWFVMDVQQLIQ